MLVTPNERFATLLKLDGQNDEEKINNLWEATVQAGRKHHNNLFAVRAGLTAILTLFCLWHVWPVWESIIDHTADQRYNVLGVSKNATMKEIKRAYRKISLAYFPDSRRQPNREYLMEVQEAYAYFRSQHDSETEGVFFISDETKDLILQATIFAGVFTGRVTSLSRHGAVFYLRSIAFRNSRMISSALSLLGIGFFISADVVAEFQYLLIIVAVLWCVPLVKGEKTFPDEACGRWEARYYAVLCIIPSLVVAFCCGNTNFEKLVMGSIYMASFVMRHRPYIFLNWGLSSRAYSGGNPVFERSNLLNLIPCPLFVRYAVEVMVDDLLAHAMHVPAPFRVCCFAILLVSHLQKEYYPALGVLSWGSPDSWDRMANQKDE
eukprot:TRINITY_DN1981_c0_g2_i1.p1 TRINITY_DN1981_c0_g2~~TRINITY_DN1981_c0_g2_i1.p1  ORF type:complete len:378 (+),score=12.05 TRINITY_DN1981_c0_g2_i1:18-1151(+)